MNNVEIFFCIVLVVVSLLLFCAWLDKRKKDKEAKRKASSEEFGRKFEATLRNPVTFTGSVKTESRHVVNRHTGVGSTRTSRDASIDDDYWTNPARNNSLNMAAQTHYNDNSSACSSVSSSSHSSDHSSSYSSSSGSSYSSSCSGSSSSSSDSGSSYSSISSSSCD